MLARAMHKAKHPKGLYPLFFTEMWERFSFYCMLALLTLYMDAPVREGGLGFDPAWTAQIYGVYKGLVYFTPLFGGLLASTLTTLIVLPSVFAVVQARSRAASASIDPRDPESSYFHPESGEPMDRAGSDRPTAIST